MKPPTKCGRVHFEHRHRKWLVITVRPTTSVRKSPRKNLPSRNIPDSFCRLLHPTKSIAALRGRYFSFMVTCRGGGPSILLTQDRSVAQKPHWGFHCCATAAFCFPKKTKNPNPSPIEKRFGFSLFGAMEGTRTPGLLIRSQSLYPAELPTHTFRSEQDVFYHAGRGLSTVFCRFFDFIFVFYFFAQKSTSFRFFNIFRADLRLPLPVARRCGHRSALRQGRPGRSPADRGRADCPRGPWHR